MDYGTLLYARRGEAVQRLSLRSGTITIGRAPESDLVLDAGDVALEHLRLLCTAGGCWVTDLGGESGTFLNLVRLQPNVRTLLRDGDILRIGPFFVRFAQARQPDQTTTTSQAEPAGQAAPATPTRTTTVLPPEIAARLPQPADPQNEPHSISAHLPNVRRLPGNGAMIRTAPGAPIDAEVSSYLQYLPPCYQEDQIRFLGRFLLIFESILEPLERTIDDIHCYFNPWLMPEQMLPWVATWLDLVLNENWPTERRRELLSATAELYRWRGTRRGLTEYIRIFAGVKPRIVEPGQDTPDSRALQPHTFKIILEVPDPEQIDGKMLEAIIEAEKPAHTSYILEIRAQRGGRSRGQGGRGTL